MFAFGGDKSSAAALREAGCSVQTFPAQRRQHVEQLPKGFKYNSSPPTSGPHHPQAAPFDVYDEPVDQIRLVHNLEHGGVVIQYGRDVPRAQVDELVEWYRDDPNGIVIAPLPALGDRISLGAWYSPEQPEGETAEPPARGVLAKCPRFEAEAFDAFLERYGFQGPERFAREQMPPGA